MIGISPDDDPGADGNPASGTLGTAFLIALATCAMTPSTGRVSCVSPNTGPPPAYPGSDERDRRIWSTRSGPPWARTSAWDQTTSPAWTTPAGWSFAPGPVYPPTPNSCSPPLGLTMNRPAARTLMVTSLPVVLSTFFWNASTLLLASFVSAEIFVSCAFGTSSIDWLSPSTF